MKALELIDDIFRRPQRGADANMRRITPEQLAYVRGLIERDAERNAVTRGAPGSLIWMPKKDRYKYVVTEDASGKKHTLTRIANLETSECGRLF
jgi:hypothetical protein